MIRRRNSLVFDLMGEYKAYFRRRDGTGKQSRKGNARKDLRTLSKAAGNPSREGALEWRDGTGKQSRKGNARKDLRTHS
jgi:hypothetical protein